MPGGMRAQGACVPGGMHAWGHVCQMGIHARGEGHGVCLSPCGQTDTVKT